MSFINIKKCFLLSSVFFITGFNLSVLAQPQQINADDTGIVNQKNVNQEVSPETNNVRVPDNNSPDTKQDVKNVSPLPSQVNTSNKSVASSPNSPIESESPPARIQFYGNGEEQAKNKNKSPNNTISSPPVVSSTPSAITQSIAPPSSIPVIKKLKSSDWVNNQVSNLDKNGVLKVPDWVDYDSLVSQKDFAIMLAKVTGIKDKSVFSTLDQQGFDKPLSRAMAIDAALRAFGLEKEMDKVIENYKTRFKDLSPEQKYYKASLTAEIIKLSAGYPDGTFRPNDLLKWSEGVAIVESVYRWASLMPSQTPIQKAEDMRKNIWFYFIDGFRLILTSIYCLLSMIFLFRAWQRAKSDRTGLRPIIASLCFASFFLFVMWLNEMLYGRGLIEKSIYYVVSLISVLAGMFLIRTSNLIAKQAEPKPKATIEVGYVDHIDLNRGEMFVIDSITKRRMLALISPDTKIYNRENRLLGSAFFSEIGQGDFVNIRGTEQISGGAIIDIDMLLILASKQNNNVNKTNKTAVSEQELNQNQIQNKYKRVV